MTTTNQMSNIGGNNNNNSLLSFPKLGLSYADVVGPSVAGGIIVSALFYTKSIVESKAKYNASK